MPPPACAKCREAPALEGDLWCLGCSAWEALGRELSGHWDVAGTRALANDLVINTTRQVRALRSLGAGLAAEAKSGGRAGTRRAHPPATAAPRRSEPPPAERERSELRRRKPPLPPGPPPGHAKREEPEDDVDSEEEEEEEEEPVLDSPREGAEPKRRPPGPDSPSRGGHKSRHRDRSRTAGHGRARDTSPGHRERRSSHQTSRRSGHHGRREHKPTRRGGRKHQRLRRLVDNPWQVVHRKATGSLLELSSVSLGAQALLQSV